MVGAPAQVVVHNLAEVEREVGDEMHGGDDLADRQVGDRRQGVRCEFQRRGSGPVALQRDVQKAVAHQLADARPAIDMRDDLQQNAGRRQIGERIRFRHRAVLEAHAGAGHRHRAEVEPAEQRVVRDGERRADQLLRKAPQLPPTGIRGVGVDIHRMDIAARLAIRQPSQDELRRDGILAEAGAVWHPDELEPCLRQAQRQRRGQQATQRLRVAAIGDGEIFAVDVAIGAHRIDLPP
jgi:hypothetical protein